MRNQLLSHQYQIVISTIVHTIYTDKAVCLSMGIMIRWEWEWCDLTRIIPPKARVCELCHRTWTRNFWHVSTQFLSPKYLAIHFNSMSEASPWRLSRTPLQSSHGNANTDKSKIDRNVSLMNDENAMNWETKSCVRIALVHRSLMFAVYNYITPALWLPYDWTNVQTKII